MSHVEVVIGAPRGNVTIYAHESQQKCSILNIDFSCTMQGLLQEFVNQKIGLRWNLDERQIEICFMFLDKNVVHHLFITGRLLV